MTQSDVPRRTFSEFQCVHKEHWAPGQRKCLRCHAKYEKEFRRKNRMLKEVSYDLLYTCRDVICAYECDGREHTRLCRMISCFLRLSKPGESRENRNRPDEAERMRKLSIWYRENEL